MNEEYPEVAEVAVQLRKDIEAFNEFVPLIKCFCSEAIMEEDWNEIRTIVGQPSMEREEVTVDKIEKNDFKKFYEEIEEVTMKAEKKFSLAKKLK